MKTIIIDAGHGGTDPGAVNGSRYEKDDNLRLARAVRDKLQERNQNVVMTRDKDVFVTLSERSAIANRSNADIFVALHRNSVANAPTVCGVDNYIRNGASKTEIDFATTILNNIINVGVQKNRGVKQENFAVLRNTKAPSMLIEMGFITNDEDNRLFDTYLDQYAQAIADGILSSIAEDGETGHSKFDPVILSIQNTLNNRYNTNLKVDGVYGNNTKIALVKGLQIELNKMYKAGLVVDGKFGARTKAHIPNIRFGSWGNLVYILQAGLYTNNYKINIDSMFGNATKDAVQKLQSKTGLFIDGVAGPNVFEKLFK